MAQSLVGAEHANPEIVDAIGERANIVAGYAKQGLSELNVTISLPSLIMASGRQIMEPKDISSFIVPFYTDLGDFHLTVGIETVE